MFVSSLYCLFKVKKKPAWTPTHKSKDEIRMNRFFFGSANEQKNIYQLNAHMKPNLRRKIFYRRRRRLRWWRLYVSLVYSHFHSHPLLICSSILSNLFFFAFRFTCCWFFFCCWEKKKITTQTTPDELKPRKKSPRNNNTELK